MNECEKILQYVQHELSPQEDAAMRTHIQTCPSCQSEIAFLNKMDEALQPKGAPADLIDRVFAQTTRKERRFFSWKKILAATVMVLVAGVVLLDVHHTSSVGFDEQELVAYVQDYMDEQYQWLEDDLSAMEEDF